MSDIDLNKPNIILSSEDHILFREWLNIDIGEVTWNGKYTKAFDRFWELFFFKELDLPNLKRRYTQLQQRLKLGPLRSWFTWLFEKHICYIFIYREITIYRLATQLDIDITKIAFILRNYFLERFPKNEEYLNSKLKVSTYLTDNINMTYEKIIENLPNNKRFVTANIGEDDLMSVLEVPIYKEWEQILRFIEKDLNVTIKSG